MNDHPETTRFIRRRLPHWEVADGRYFVTIRLKGAIPEAGMQQIRLWRERYEAAVVNGQDGLRESRALFREMERCLDRSDTVDHLTQPDVAAMVRETIDYREKAGIWRMFAYTLMPNHVHLFFALGEESSRDAAVASGSRCFVEAATEVPSSASQTPQTPRRGMVGVLEDFKRWTATKAGALLSMDGDTFWQREWFDHWSRSSTKDESIARYIRENPVKAGLVSRADEWPWTGGTMRRGYPVGNS